MYYQALTVGQDADEHAAAVERVPPARAENRGVVVERSVLVAGAFVVVGLTKAVAAWQIVVEEVALVAADASPQVPERREAEHEGHEDLDSQSHLCRASEASVAFFLGEVDFRGRVWA